jgi:hypothetical protein
MEVSLNIKMADLDKKNVPVWKGIICQKVPGTAVTICTLRLWWSNMQNKQTTVKWQENVLSPEENVQS